ncbi:hypothetical protein FHU41_002834 [Psychromicrobium silvestre]|uniref:Proteinase inhibitor I25 cystatin n=1 Tax=Psychromicrobium silvestre TaxID=1645614 RepID=A0A7Y9LVW8_9MICC|nr:DUF2505 domain-containing protein [Psychromicrobium silvestre]NYE96584.1 hypothetical protein [Psychromicrobium silvestre]
MALSTSASLSAGVEQVVELFSSEDFVRQVSEAAGGTLESFTLTGDRAAAFSTVSVRSMPTDRLPELAKKFVGARLNVQQQEQWSAPAADGSREVQISAKISGAPVEAKAVQRIVAEGASTRIELEGTVTSSIPLFGNKIVQAAEPALAKALNLQVSEARKVLESA